MKKAILKTLAYADIFDYPLTQKEIYKFLISDKTSSLKLVQNRLAQTRVDKKTGIGEKNGLYFLVGRNSLVKLRKQRKRFSRRKLEIGKKAADLLKFIPTARLVGVTGRLAMENCDKNDDVDLLIISSKGSLWLTRFLATVLVELTGRRRRPREEEVEDKICLNMFLSEEALVIPENERDMYSAHEIVQMRLIWNRGKTYQKFLKANQWVREYLPNAIEKDIKILRYKDIKRTKERNFLSILVSQYLSLFERLAQCLQLWYMRGHRTTEVVTDTYIRFHPQSARDWILPAYRRRLQKLKLL